MNTQNQIPNQKIAREAALPTEPGKPYWVQCKAYRCLAVVDLYGRWWCCATGQELVDVIKVYH